MKIVFCTMWGDRSSRKDIDKSGYGLYFHNVDYLKSEQIRQQ